jgi:hypothetical protein
MRYAGRGALVGILAVLLLGALGVMVVAAGSDSVPAPLERAIRRHERLHFGLHLAAGRVLSVCPCTRDQSQEQYGKAAAHAPSPQERALVTSERPHRYRDGPEDLFALGRYGAWISLHSTEAQTALGVLALCLAALGFAWRTRRPGRAAA